MAEATGDGALRKFAAAVKREGAVAERVVRGWGEKPASLDVEIMKAIAASNTQRKTAAT